MLLKALAGEPLTDEEKKLKLKVEKSLDRFDHYVREGFRPEMVSPINEEWIKNALSLLTSDVPLLADEFVEREVRAMLHSIRHDYRVSMKESILNYVLKNIRERRRLRIPIPPRSAGHEWGHTPVPLSAPRSWRRPIQEAYSYINDNLVLFNPALVELLNVWKEFESLSLFSEPPETEFPISIHDFEIRQKQHMTKVRDTLLKDWHKRVEGIFQEYVDEADIDEHTSEKLFNCVATIMSTQLRGIVERSVIEFHDFFVKASKSRSLTFQQGENEEDICTINSVRRPGEPVASPVFKLSLLMHNPKHKNKSGLITPVSENDAMTMGRHVAISYNTLLSDFERTVSTIFDSVVHALDNIPRVENKIFSLLEENKNLNLNIAMPTGSAVGADDNEVTSSKSGEEIWSFKPKVEALVKASTVQANHLYHLYDAYSYILDEDVRVTKYLRTTRSLDEYQGEITKYRSVGNMINERTTSEVFCSMVYVDSSFVNRVLGHRAGQLAQQILTFLANKNIEKNIHICDRFKNSASILLKKPISSQELVNLTKYHEQFRKIDLENLKKDCAVARQNLDFLFDFGYQVGEDVLAHMGASWNWLSRIEGVLNDSTSLIRNERGKLTKHLTERRDNFENVLESYQAQVKEFTQFGDIKKTSEYISKIVVLKENLSKAEEEVTYIHEQEALLGLANTEFDVLNNTMEALEPFEQLWNLTQTFTKAHHAWLKGPVFKLESEDVTKKLDEMWRSAFKLANDLSEASPEPSSVASHVKKELEEFKPNLPLLSVLCNRGMRERHWKQVSDTVGFDLRPDDHTSLTRVLDMGVSKHIDRLLEISEAASKQYAIEKALEAMRGEWEGVKFEFKSHRDTGTFILQGVAVEEVQTLLDDHLMKTQAMKGSSFAKPFLSDISSWETLLMCAQSIIEMWIKVQAQWMYLEPVFSAPDINKQMPSEGSMFKIVDGSWRQIMDVACDKPEVFSVINVPNMLNQLTEAFEYLEKIQAGLNQYLETKRLFFPRFFFLSNDELLEILSETKDPLRVQPHLKKCFEGVHNLEFADNLDIAAMRSKEGESINMVRTVNPNDADGAVESWLKDVEAVMYDTILDQCCEAVKDFEQCDRNEWVLKWPGQVVLAVSQIFWTRAVEAALNGGKGNLRQFLSDSNDQLNSIVMLVRGKLSKLARATLGALVVIDVHARDVIQKLINSNVSSTSDFDWVSQLRYYWEEDMVKVRMITSTLDYGNEYLGNSSRLVITPLTDRCYRTLMGALQLQLGGAPEGPAGTGKTETVKDLAKAVGIQCVVFNCSDGLDYLAMAKFFKGLAASGAWACFDEFNRIDLEVLSVVAQQIHTIILAKEARLDTFVFEGSQLPLRRTCNVFITMNPGYAGRSELPDNLKALFRTVAMMVPDYAMIAEILLYSYGFVNARNLSRKIVATYRLCSEQLSSQDHYDYGMRAVRTVLTAAKNLKQAYPQENEDVLMLRSIVDVNLPKFLSQDLPLFEGIISDLFPGVELPSLEYADLLQSINQQMAKMNLQPVPAFVKKILQLYETIKVRHGLMIVGESFAGKTAAYRILAGAISDLARQGKMDEKEVEVTVINPKSVTIGQLYGQFDDVSHEWSDGVLACKFRDFASSPSPNRKWLMFDGPVDAVWIENMNTVLDDNKKLCLMSGEIIQMSDTMNLIFEVSDLAVASPATVSRCGMVYMEPSSLGWQPLMESWINKLPKTVVESEKEVIRSLFTWMVDPCLRHLRSKCSQYSPASDSNLVSSLMKIFSGLLHDSNLEKVLDPADAVMQTRRVGDIESMFLFSLVWSVGGTIDDAGRATMDQLIREISKEADTYKMSPSSHFPAISSVYDYMYDVTTSKWISWSDKLDPEFSIAAGTKFQQIMVPTVDTSRYSFLLDLFIRDAQPVMLVGPTGTGKSVYVHNKLNHNLDTNLYSTIVINFSAQTSANQTQFLIDDKMDRRRRGVFGPSGGKKCVVFVDDLNMPKQEVYGAQPPIELVRQFFDHGGWYDTKESSFRNIEDVQFVAAMGPPGGGRSFVTDRLLRHFAQVAITPFDDNTLSTIFRTIVDWHFTSNMFSSDVLSLSENIVSATTKLFHTATQNLLPTPAKSHYTFNLRDFSRVIQGILFSTPDHFHEPDAVIRLWIHEVHRVFGDRLIDDNDATSFLGWVRDITKDSFHTEFDKVCSHLDTNGDGKVDTIGEVRNLFFGDYMSKKHPRPYVEVLETEQLETTWTQYLEDYNALSNKPMNLVMFRFAIEHASRISRILKQPGGNALLVGVGGSGKQSLTRLAASVLGYDLIQIELSKNYGQSEWKDDLRRLLRKAGAEGTPTVFLFSDTQIKDESFLEDVNGLLNSGEVPNLWAPDELSEIYELIRPAAKKSGKCKEGTPAQLFSFFTEQVRQNLHIVLCMSPIGGTFRDRLRMFPALINCCTINWFQAWPSDALMSVARQFLGEEDLDQKTKDACVSLCMDMHRSVEKASTEFYSELRRHYYVTPTSYLELITTFKSLLGEKREKTESLRKRYEIGLQKLHDTEVAVKDMQNDLEDMQPILARTSDDTDEMIKVVHQETVEANKIREEVKREEEVAAEAAARAKAIENECAADLAEAMPILQAALSALDTLTTRELSEIKVMRNPPQGVKLVMECLCHIKEISPARIPDPSGSGKMITDFWEPSKKYILSDTKLLRSLREYDKDNIPVKVIQKIRGFQAMPEFEIENIKKVSKAAHALASWIYAMEAYDRVAKVVQPKKEALAKAQAEFAEVKEKLDEAQSELAKVEAHIKDLNDKLDSMKQKKENLEHKMEDCSKKLTRANTLLGGLGGEKDRWTILEKQLREEFNNITGDVIISSGVVAYLGAFTSEFRQKCVEQWTARIVEEGVPCSGRFSLASVCGEPVQIRQWAIDGLPNDTLSIDNGIIVSKSRRWPLMIDPQGQANKWIRAMESENNLVVIKPNEDYARQLETAIQFGHPVLLEDLGETLDPALEPLLLKQVVRKANTNVINFGDQEIEYSPNFRFYMTTKLRNPHYLPEVSTRVTLLNFMITQVGLQDQLLGIVVAKEKPELEEERSKLIVASAQNAKKLKEIEDEILQVLSSSQGNILDDEAAIQVLSASKTLSNEIQEKQEIAAKTEEEIELSRSRYKPVAFHASILFFCVADMANIDPMYQYSLDWFIRLYTKSISKSEFSHDIDTRISNLNDFFTHLLHTNVCRSLFEKDKLLFTFLLHIKQQAARGLLDSDHWRFLLTGGVGVSGDGIPNPAEDWLQPRNWASVCRLNYENKFDGLAKSFQTNPSAWRKVYDSSSPQHEPLPSPWNENMSAFEKLLILRCLRPDKVIPAIRDVIRDEMSPEFTEFPGFDLKGTYADSTPASPIVFILSAGSDPMASILKFAAEMEFSENVQSVSLGQGQGPIAARMIQQGIKNGTWVVLQNCHLAVSWMAELERICASIPASDPHPSFRLFLTSYPSPHFPVAILQNGVKLTTEPPKGLRANLLNSYTRDPINNEDFFAACQKDRQLKTMVYSLCFFHALVQERRNFGPLGWNTPYGFNESDLRISVRQLQMFLNEDGPIPYKALNYLTGECNYGGRVTDEWDRRTLLSMLRRFFTEKIHEDNYSLSVSGTYTVPTPGPLESYTEQIKSLPVDTHPEIFGLHENANITKDEKETTVLFESILLTESRSASSAGKGKDEIVTDIANGVLSRLPAAFDLSRVKANYPISYNESMNTVLTQECLRYNDLTKVIRTSLTNLLKAIRGTVVMDPSLESVGAALFTGKVPDLWMKVSYPSLKPLGGYVTDLCERLSFLSKWIEHGIPSVVWMPGIFFTQSFLTGVLQNYARKYAIPVDEVEFEFKFMDKGAINDRSPKPADGVYVRGLFFEGAAWSYKEKSLVESNPKILFTEAPVIWLKPCRSSEKSAAETYACPVYRVSSRRGTLSTTGHSTNYVMTIRVPSNVDSDHWVGRGVALLTMLDD